MKLYIGALSLFSRKVEIALREKGLAYERELVPFTQATGYAPKHPAVIAANPKQQVPVLVDDDLTVFDSTVILEYLEDAYPLPALYPAAPETRADCRLLELTADEILFAPVRQLLYRTEPADPVPERQFEREAQGKRAEAAIRQQLAALDQRLAGTPDRAYFCGAFSVADIGLFMTILFVQRLKGPAISEWPHLAAWYRRMLGRPAVAIAAEEIAAADRELSPALK